MLVVYDERKPLHHPGKSQIHRDGGEVATSGTVRRVRSVDVSLSSLDSESSSLGARLLPRTSTLLFIWHRGCQR